MIDTSPNSNLKDTVLHTLFNRVNSQERKNIQAVAHSVVNVNIELSKQHIIQEPETSRDDLNNVIFGRMDAIENINGKSQLNVYLNRCRVRQADQIQAAKNVLNELKSKDRENDDMNFLQ